MTARLYRFTAIAFVIAATAFGQQTPEKTFRLYRVDPACDCTAVRHKTQTVTGTDTRVGKELYEVFRSTAPTKQELFRVPIGSYIHGKLVKLWLYGIASEKDFNGDGIPDYAWYGGDDTGFEMHLYLSSATQGYIEVDLLKTLQSAWQNRFQKKAPDFGEVDGNYDITKLELKNSGNGLLLLATINKTSWKSGKRLSTYSFAIEQKSFQP